MDHAFFIGPDGLIQEVYQYKSIPGNDDSILVLTGIQDGMEVWEENPATDFVRESPGEGFYKPKWTDGIWVEGMTAEEIEALQKAQNVHEPTIEELQAENADLKSRLEAVEFATITLMDFM